METARQASFQCGDRSVALLKDKEEEKRYVFRCPNAITNNGGRRSWLLLFVFFAMFIFILGLLIGYFSKSEECLNENNEPSGRRGGFHIQTLLKVIDIKKINNTSRLFSSQPHYAGSQRQKELADKIKNKWTGYGFDVDMPEYDVLISIPDEKNPDCIKLVDDTGNTLLNEPFMTKQVKADPHDNKTWNIPRYSFYSPSGHVEGGLLYVNEGRKEDFELLKNLNISSCNGSVVILKIRKQSYDLIEQMKNAFECNALGVIFFPEKDVNASLPTLTKNNTYPNGIWPPKDIPLIFSFIRKIGDPLTPGLPATPGTYRVDKNEIEDFPKLPFQFVNYNMSKRLLQYLKGSKIPTEWKLELDENMEYHVGPDLRGNSTFHFTINTKTIIRKVYNVIGTVLGKDEPDHWVLLGNHRDAIAFGGADAVSGTAGMMEVSRGIGELLKRGWKPRRSIKFVSWAAEEPGVIGSNEWVEDNIKLLQERAVAYINMDMLVSGNYKLKSKGNPMLTDLIFSQTKLVKAPEGNGDTVYSMWKKRNPSSKDPSVPMFVTSGGATDYQPFYELAGVPCLELQYIPESTDNYQTYHTPYDTYHWVKQIDPHFKVHLAQTQLAARLLLNLTDSLLVPFNLTYLSSSLEEILQQTNIYYEEDLRERNISLGNISQEAKKLRDTIQEFEKTKHVNITEQKIRMLNRRMVSINKMFLSPEGVPNRPWIKNILHGISENMKYPKISLVAISDAIIEAQKSGNWKDVKHQVSVTCHCIKQARDALQMP